MRVSRKVVRQQIVAHRNELAIGSPWSPATPGTKYCGALMPPEAVSMGMPGMETGAPGRPGIGIQQLFPHHHPLGRIRRKKRDRDPEHGDRLRYRREPLEMQLDLGWFRIAFGNHHLNTDRGEQAAFRAELVSPRWHTGEFEISRRVARRLAQHAAGGIEQRDVRSGHRNSQGRKRTRRFRLPTPRPLRVRRPISQRKAASRKPIARSRECWRIAGAAYRLSVLEVGDGSHFYPPRSVPDSWDGRCNTLLKFVLLAGLASGWSPRLCPP